MDRRLETIARLNYWNDNHFDNGLRRDLYLDRILPYIVVP